MVYLKKKTCIIFFFAFFLWLISVSQGLLSVRLDSCMMIPDVSLGWAVPLYTRPLCHTGLMCTDMDKVIDFDDDDDFAE